MQLCSWCYCFNSDNKTSLSLLNVLRVIWPNSLFASQSQPEAKPTYHEFDHQDQSQWNFNPNTTISIKADTFANIICNMMTILFGSHWDNTRYFSLNFLDLPWHDTAPSRGIIVGLGDHLSTPDVWGYWSWFCSNQGGPDLGRNMDVQPLGTFPDKIGPFSWESSQQIPHNLPMGVRYGVSM